MKMWHSRGGSNREAGPTVRSLSPKPAREPGELRSCRHKRKDTLGFNPPRAREPGELARIRASSTSLWFQSAPGSRARGTDCHCRSAWTHGVSIRPGRLRLHRVPKPVSIRPGLASPGNCFDGLGVPCVYVVSIRPGLASPGNSTQTGTFAWRMSFNPPRAREPGELAHFQLQFP